MNSLNLAQHIINAVYIIRTNTIILWFLGFIGLTSSVNSLYPDNPLYGFNIFLFVCTAIFATPIIYGMYYEIIKDTYSSVPAIAKRYVPQYIWLLLRLYLPVVIFAAMPVISSPETVSAGYFQMVIISCSLIFIYIIPTYFVSGTQQGAVVSGIQFLVQNLSASAPLILISLLTEAFLLIFEMKKGILIEFNNLSFVLADFFIYMAANIIDFVLFITMIFVLLEVKDKQNNPDAHED